MQVLNWKTKTQQFPFFFLLNQMPSVAMQNVSVILTCRIVFDLEVCPPHPEIQRAITPPDCWISFKCHASLSSIDDNWLLTGTFKKNLNKWTLGQCKVFGCRRLITGRAANVCRAAAAARMSQRQCNQRQAPPLLTILYQSCRARRPKHSKLQLIFNTVYTL